jgi:hypothetical protein
LNSNEPPRASLPNSFWPMAFLAGVPQSKTAEQKCRAGFIDYTRQSHE